jgi:hypothetical protein
MGVGNDLLGALAGRLPDAAMGVPHTAGLHLDDDFHDEIASRWTTTTIGGTAPAYSQQSPASIDVVGCSQILTGAVINTGGVAQKSTVADHYRTPGPGALWAVKLRTTTASANYDLWSGFASAAASVRVGDATQFVGVRVDRAVSGNLFGVVKSGAGAGAESTIDLGVSPEASAWQSVGFARLADGTIQFFVGGFTDRDDWAWVKTGSPLPVTYLPTVKLFSTAIGIVTRTADARSVQVDWWDLGGRCIRG